MESIEVKDYMNHYPVTFTSEMVVEEAALRFLKTKQIGGPVIDSKNHVSVLETVAILKILNFGSNVASRVLVSVLNSSIYH